MPFVFVWGIPEHTPDSTLIELRRTVVSTVIESMKVDPAWVRVFFPKDLLTAPAQSGDGNNNIYVTIETGMLYNQPESSPEPKNITQAVALVIWQAFKGQVEVECFIGNHNPTWVSLLHANH